MDHRLWLIQSESDRKQPMQESNTWRAIDDAGKRGEALKHGEERGSDFLLCGEAIE